MASRPRKHAATIRPTPGPAHAPPALRRGAPPAGGRDRRPLRARARPAPPTSRPRRARGARPPCAVPPHPRGSRPGPAPSATSSSRNRMHGDVVAPAGVVGGVDERRGRLVERGRRAQDLRHDGLADHRRQAVAAQQEDVAGARGEGVRVGLDDGLGPERARDDRALRMLLGLLGLQPALAHQLLDERVIGRQALELAVAPAVAAAVADVGDRHVVLADVGSGQRRAHPGARVVGHRQRVDALVGLLHGDAEALLDAAVARGQPALEDLDRGPRGDLPRLRAAHAVGHREQRRARDVRVLVGAALAAGVGALDVLGDAQHQLTGPRT